MTTSPTEHPSQDQNSTQTSFLDKQEELLDEDQDAMSGLITQEAPVEGQEENVAAEPRAKLLCLLKGKEKEWAAARNKDGPLELLDLPLDVLKCIINEVRRTAGRNYGPLLTYPTGHAYKRLDVFSVDQFRTQ